MKLYHQGELPFYYMIESVQKKEAINPEGPERFESKQLGTNSNQ